MNTENELKARAAVNDAVDFILHNPGTTGANSLARVLLHAYNHAVQPLDITDLCVLDEPRRDIARTILNARIDGVEPQELVSNQKDFQAVVDIYGQSRTDPPGPVI